MRWLSVRLPLLVVWMVGVKVEELGVWPEGLLDAHIVMIPKVGGDSTPLGWRPLCVLPLVYRIWASARLVQLESWFKSWVHESVYGVGGGRSAVEAWYTTALDIEEVLTGAVDSHVYVFVADVVKSFDTVDKGVLDHVLSSLGLPAWFRHAYFEYPAHVRLRFKLVAWPWTRDGGIPQGCPLSMMFTVALYLPWCWYLGAQEGFSLSCMLTISNVCVCVQGSRAAVTRRSVHNWVCSVSRSRARPSKCVLLSTSKAVRGEMRGWVLSEEGD